MQIADVKAISREILQLLDEYHNPPHRELLLDPILYASLSARYPKVSRQHYVYLYGLAKPQRIDFRIGGTNPVVLELAPRKPAGGGSLYGGQNLSELRKLCRVKQTAAKLRVLLLLDLATTPLTVSALKPSYDKLHAGPGKFQRNPVRVVYVHKKIDFDFLWRPCAN